MSKLVEVQCREPCQFLFEIIVSGVAGSALLLAVLISTHDAPQPAIR